MGYARKLQMDGEGGWNPRIWRRNPWLGLTLSSNGRHAVYSLFCTSLDISRETQHSQSQFMTGTYLIGRSLFTTITTVAEGSTIINGRDWGWKDLQSKEFETKRNKGSNRHMHFIRGGLYRHRLLLLHELVSSSFVFRAHNFRLFGV